MMPNRRVKYSAGEIGRVKAVEDVLPSPDALVEREDNVKVPRSRRPRTRGPVSRKTARKPK